MCVGGALHGVTAADGSSKSSPTASAAAAAPGVAVTQEFSNQVFFDLASVPQLPSRSPVDGLCQLVTSAPQVNTQADQPTSLFVYTYATSPAS